MGWASGSRLVSQLIESAKDTISNTSERSYFYEQMIEIFEEFDCDTMDECVGVDTIFDEVWEKYHPSDDYGEWNEDDDM
jgi:hypothetical protein